MQYEGHVSTIEFGWLWKQRLRECILDRGMTVKRTMLEMGYPDTTIRKYAVLMDIMPLSRMPPRRHRDTNTKIRKKAPETPESRKARWLQLIANNSDLGRVALGRKDIENYKWLLANDN